MTIRLDTFIPFGCNSRTASVGGLSQSPMRRNATGVDSCQLPDMGWDYNYLSPHRPGHPSVTERPVALPPNEAGGMSWAGKKYHPNRSGTNRPKPSNARPRSCLTAESAKSYCARRACWRPHPISTNGYRRLGCRHRRRSLASGAATGQPLIYQIAIQHWPAGSRARLPVWQVRP